MLINRCKNHANLLGLHEFNYNRNLVFIILIDFINNN